MRAFFKRMFYFLIRFDVSRKYVLHDQKEKISIFLKVTVELFRKQPVVT